LVGIDSNSITIRGLLENTVGKFSNAGKILHCLADKDWWQVLEYVAADWLAKWGDMAELATRLAAT